MVGDWFLELIENGAIDTAAPDACLASLAVGSRRIYSSLCRQGILSFAKPVDLQEPIPGSPLMAVNSAIDVDLAGQVNAEFLGERYAGAVGCQTDHFRAARRSAGGLAILALPATTGRKAMSTSSSPSTVRLTSGPSR